MTPPLRLLTYNVRSLRDDPAAVARVIRAADAHVVCLQEAPRFLRWRTTCAALARRSGLVVVSGGRTAAGNLVLSSLGVEVLEARDELLTPVPRLHQRGLVLARLCWRGREFALASTHLDLDEIARRQHIDEVLAHLARFAGADVATVVAADVNDEPGSPAWAQLSAQHVDAFAAVGSGSGLTFSAASPSRRLDAVFADARLTPVSADVLDSPDVVVASDHRPLVVELAIS